MGKDTPLRVTPGFPYLLDEEGPKGIAVSSWLDRARLALVLNDFQKFCIWKSTDSPIPIRGSDTPRWCCRTPSASSRGFASWDCR